MSTSRLSRKPSDPLGSFRFETKAIALVVELQPTKGDVEILYTGVTE